MLLMHQFTITEYANELTTIIDMIKGGTGGGNTITGLIYEAKVDLGTFLDQQKDVLGQ